MKRTLLLVLLLVGCVPDERMVNIHELPSVNGPLVGFRPLDSLDLGEPRSDGWTPVISVIGDTAGWVLPR